MSLINPSQAPSVIIHPLPNNYLMATCKVVPHDKGFWLELKAFMPKGHGRVYTEDGESSVDEDEAYYDFKQDTCKSCDYYFNTYSSSDYIDGDCDGDGNQAIEITYKSRCPCRAYGISYVHWPCAAGHEDPASSCSSDIDGLSMPPMAYSVHLSLSALSPGLPVAHYACVHKCDPESGLVGNLVFRSLNTHSDNLICWGTGNDDPEGLPEAINQYIDSPANEDLLHFAEYKKILAKVHDVPCGKPVDDLLIQGGHDAVLIVTAVHQKSAYLLLRASGYQAKNGIIAIGLTSFAIEHDGEHLQGYVTPAKNGRSWFVLPHPGVVDDENLQWQALLLAQIPDPLSPCSSHAPSSSAPAALAAS